MSSDVLLPSVPPEAGAARPVESVRLRYATTLMTQFMQLGLSVITAGIVPRALGPIAFGNYNFILNMASTIRSFTDLGANITFFTFSSQEKNSGALTRMYGIWLFVQLGLALLLVGFSVLTRTTHFIWPGQSIYHVLGITCLEWLVFLALILRQLGDTKGFTVRTQMISAGTMLLTTVGLVLLMLQQRLTLHAYVGWLTGVNLLSCGALAFYLLIRRSSVCWKGDLHHHRSTYIQRWKKYASPLVVFGLYGSLAVAVDTYFIQRLYGSSEQAFLSLATRWSSLVLVFTTSMLTIYWRELTASLAHKDTRRATDIYLRSNRLMFFLSVLAGCWLCFNARFIVTHLAGASYAAAVPVMMVMAFYPVAQTTGQLSSIALLASERTALYRDLGIALSLPNLALTYWVLAPRHAHLPGLELGALGIALKTVGFSLLSVNVYDWLISKQLQFSWGSEVIKRYSTALWVIAIAWLCLGAFRLWLEVPLGWDPLGSLLFSSIVYIGMAGTLLYQKPTLAGLTSQDLTAAFHSFQRRAARLFEVPRV